MRRVARHAGKWKIVYEEWEYFHILEGYSIARKRAASRSTFAPATADPETWLRRDLGSGRDDDQGLCDPALIKRRPTNQVVWRPAPKGSIEGREWQA